MKRKIVAHKGGRDQVWPTTRLTNAERDLMCFVLENRGISFSDWIVEKAKEDQELILRVAAVSGYRTSSRKTSQESKIAAEKLEAYQNGSFECPHCGGISIVRLIGKRWYHRA